MRIYFMNLKQLFFNTLLFIRNPIVFVDTRVYNNNSYFESISMIVIKHFMKNLMNDHTVLVNVNGYL